MRHHIILAATFFITAAVFGFVYGMYGVSAHEDATPGSVLIVAIPALIYIFMLSKWLEWESEKYPEAGSVWLQRLIIWTPISFVVLWGYFIKTRSAVKGMLCCLISVVVFGSTLSLAFVAAHFGKAMHS